jgi:hypothetical protein
MNCMTMMQGREARVGEHLAGDLGDELDQLRATDAALRDELIEVRRQRDEAVSQAQWLILRVSNAEQVVERLQAELIEARSQRGVSVAPVVGADPVAVVEGTVVVGADADANAEVVAAPAASVDDALEVEDGHDDQAAPEPAAAVPDAAVTPVAIVPGAWAGQAGPWLPPEEDAADGSTAHEFAALTERALAVEAAQAEEAAAAAPAPLEMNVLPEVYGEPKKAAFFRRR